jgi:hypothetical protein
LRQERTQCQTREPFSFDNPARSQDSDLSARMRQALTSLFQECLNTLGCVLRTLPPSLLRRFFTAVSMFTKSVVTPLLALSSLALQTTAVSHKQWSKRSDHLYLPKETSDYKTATAPNNVTIRYKNPGICETTPGVDSYSGYVDLTPDVSINLTQT